jgi:hypothetical protein
VNNNSVRISWFGIVLIVLGLIMLLDRFHLVMISFGTVFWPLVMLLGIVTVVRGFSDNRTGKIFWGTVMFLFALFFFLRSSEYFEVRAHVFPPALFLIFGIAFLMTFVNNVREWYMLIPAIAFGGIGVFLILVEYGYIYRWDAWEVWNATRLYWPILVILFGLALMLRRSGRTNSHHVTQ